MYTVSYKPMLHHICLDLLWVTLDGLASIASLVIAQLRPFLASTCIANISSLQFTSDSLLGWFSTDLARQVLAIFV